MLLEIGWNNGLKVSLLDIYDTGLHKSLQKLVEAAKDGVVNQNPSKQTQPPSRWARLSNTIQYYW